MKRVESVVFTIGIECGCFAHDRVSRDDDAKHWSDLVVTKFEDQEEFFHLPSFVGDHEVC